MKYKVLKETSLVSKKATGKTKHYLGNDELPMPAKLQIAQYDNDDGFYLFYFDENNERLTDTYHTTIQDAIAQADWEFEVKEEEWITSE